MGSDWPVSTPDPLAAIHVAVNRTVFGEHGRAGTEPFLPEQRISLETAFAAYTSGSAWVNHRDDAGLVAPGRVADLVVLDRDPFAAPASEIGATQVVSTWIAGEPVLCGDPGRAAHKVNDLTWCTRSPCSHCAAASSGSQCPA